MSQAGLKPERPNTETSPHALPHYRDRQPPASNMGSQSSSGSKGRARQRGRRHAAAGLIGALIESNFQIDSSPLREWCERYGVRRASEIEYERSLVSK